MDGKYTFMNKVKSTHALLAMDPKTITEDVIAVYLTNVPEGATMPYIANFKSKSTSSSSRRDEKLFSKDE